MLTHFQNIYRQVTEYLVSKGQFETDIVQTNPKGDQTKAFDYNTEEMVLHYFEQHVPGPIKVMTEERGEIAIGDGTPEYTIIIDPVDGSDNLTRQLGMTGFSIAAIPAGAPLTVEQVEYALVGHIFLEKVFTAQKGQGAYCNQVPIRSSEETDLRKSLLTAYIVSKEPQDLERVYPLLQQMTSMRCFGSAAYEICQVAAGGLEGYLDIRHLCTPENFIAAAMIVREAGGVVSDEYGNALAPITRLDFGYNIVVSGNQALHDTILTYLSTT